MYISSSPTYPHRLAAAAFIYLHGWMIDISNIPSHTRITQALGGEETRFIGYTSEGSQWSTGQALHHLAAHH